MKIRLTYAVLALGVGYSGAAFAQDQVWLKDRRYGEGVGIRTGDVELHPGIAGEFGYDSNYFLRSGAANEPVIDTLRLRITPSFSLSTISQQRRESEGGGGEPPKVMFRAGAALSYSEFFATKSQYSDAMTKQRNFGALANLQLTILPQRPFGGDLSADFLRTVQPSNDPNFNFDRMNARFAGGIVWAPGGGMFDWRVGYEYGIVFFEDTSFRNFGNYYNQVNTRGRWRFLPRTALMFDGSATFLRYSNNPNQAASTDSDPIRARIGLNGLVTNWFAFLGMVGWGSSFYKPNPLMQNPSQYDSLIAQAEFKFYLTPNPGLDPAAATLTLSTVALGYSRDFFNSYLGNYYARDRGYVNLSYFFGGRFLVVADAGLASLGYPLFTFPVRQDPFRATYFDSSLFGEYRVTDSVGINTTLRYTSNASTTVATDDLSFKRFEAFIGVRWFL